MFYSHSLAVLAAFLAYEKEIDDITEQLKAAQGWSLGVKLDGIHSFIQTGKVKLAEARLGNLGTLIGCTRTSQLIRICQITSARCS